MRKLLCMGVLVCAVACTSPETRATGSDSAFDNTLNSPKGVHDGEDSMGRNSGIDTSVMYDSTHKQTQ